MPSPPPRISGYDDVRPVAGGNSGEVFLARSAATGDDVVVRAYGAGRRRRGPEAPGVHAAVLRRVDGVVPARGWSSCASLSVTARAPCS